MSELIGWGNSSNEPIRLVDFPSISASIWYFMIPLSFLKSVGNLRNASTIIYF